MKLFGIVWVGQPGASERAGDRAARVSEARRADVLTQIAGELDEHL